MTTAEVFLCYLVGPSLWNPAPAPNNGPYFIRTKGNFHCVLHGENWLVKAIHGDDYEWSYPLKV